MTRPQMGYTCGVTASGLQGTELNWSTSSTQWITVDCDNSNYVKSSIWDCTTTVTDSCNSHPESLVSLYCSNLRCEEPRADPGSCLAHGMECGWDWDCCDQMFCSSHWNGQEHIRQCTDPVTSNTFALYPMISANFNSFEINMTS